jgi:hypothetical protein
MSINSDELNRPRMMGAGTNPMPNYPKPAPPSGPPSIAELTTLRERVKELELVIDNLGQKNTMIMVDELEQQNALLTLEAKRLRDALRKIADWDSAWGPFPETNKAWCSMVVVTAREAVPKSPLHPLDTSALDAYVEPYVKEIKRYQKAIKKQGERCDVMKNALMESSYKGYYK